jgi:DNA polymerase III epsilon subunit-like protein
MYIYNILDVETSGFDTSKHDIAEIAILTCNGQNIVNIFHQFYSVNEFSIDAQQCNGLSVEKLRYFDKFNNNQNLQIIKKILQPNIPIWAHNSIFDCRFLSKYGVISNFHVFKDSLSVLRKKNKDRINKLPNNKLSTWLEYYNIQVQTHTALGDAFGLYKIITLEGFYLN